MSTMPPGLLETPALGPCLHTPHGYQIEFIDAIRAEFKRGIRRTLIEMFTGGGKGFLAGFLARPIAEHGKRVLITTPRRSLVEDLADKLDLLGIEAGIEMGDLRARALFEPQVVVASCASLYKARLASYPANYFDYIIMDEVHHVSEDNELYLGPIKHFDRARVIGMTATAFRHDEKELGKVFQSIAKRMNIVDAATHPDGPFVCRPFGRRMLVDIDLKGMKPSRFDSSMDELDARIAPRAELLANCIAQEIGERPTIVFTAGVRSAEGVASAIHNLGIKAVWTSGDDPRQADKIRAYKSGEAQVFVNCGVATEGFDYQPTACVVRARPTKSNLTTIQEIGRGTRPHRSKNDCLVLEPGWMADEDVLSTCVDLVDRTGLDRETFDEAKSMFDEASQKQVSVDLIDLIMKAEAKVVDKKDKERRREELRVEAERRQILYKRVEYDLVAAAEAVGLPTRRTTKEAVISKATDGQVRFLKTFGVSGVENASRTRAKTLLDYLNGRRKAGLGEVWQVGKLIALGVDATVARSLPKKEAQARLDEFRQMVK